jgi:hypothetical protein
MDTHSIHNLALIDFVGRNVHLAILYFVFFEVLLVFLAIRKCPPWSAWLIFCALAAPCFLYLGVCAHFLLMPVLLHR